MKNREFGLDLVRTFAIFCVVLVHSFMHSGFNNTNLSGVNMFILLFIRCISQSGVLLFIALTGYLKNKKEVNKKHYTGIIDILLTYLVISIICIIYRMYVIKDGRSILFFIKSIFNFSAAPYAWYVEMYIGLFFFIPFLNILYHNIKTKKEKVILLITLFCFTSLFPTITNFTIFNHYLDILPNFWYMLYPIFMYFVGCFISEYKIKFAKNKLLALLIATIFVNTSFLFICANGKSFNSIAMTTLESYLFTVITVILIFLLFYDLKINKKVVSKIIVFLSKGAFGTYLISFCFDDFLYKNTAFIKHNPYYFFICSLILTPIIFILSSFSSYLIDSLIKYCKSLVKKR